MIQQMTQTFFILGYGYDETSVKGAEEFLFKCRSLLGNESNLFWVAIQSNLLADMINVNDDFETAFKESKEALSMKGWFLPTLEANMRNQVNIANINIEQGYTCVEMQSKCYQNSAKMISK